MSGSENGMSGGAFVELDHTKLNAAEWYMLGAKAALDKWIATLREKAIENPDRPPIPEILFEVASRMAMDRDELAVALTKHAIKSKSATMNNAYGKKIQ